VTVLERFPFEKLTKFYSLDQINQAAQGSEKAGTIKPIIRPIPASAIVVSKAPQIELLKRAELCITHAGINTTLESLARVPCCDRSQMYTLIGTIAECDTRKAGRPLSF
jgi:hypothetical protein